MDMVDIKQKTGAEIERLLGEQRALLQTLRFQAAEHQLKNTQALKVCKKTIARLLTRQQQLTPSV